MSIEMSIVVLINNVIFAYLHVFPIQDLFTCEFACVMFDMWFCIILMWVLHFEVEGPFKVWI